MSIQYRLRSFLPPQHAQAHPPAKQRASVVSTLPTLARSPFGTRAFSSARSSSPSPLLPSFLSSSIRIRLKLHHLLPFFLLPSSPLRLLFCALPSFPSLSSFPPPSFPRRFGCIAIPQSKLYASAFARQSQLHSHSICRTHSLSLSVRPFARFAHHKEKNKNHSDKTERNGNL